MGTKLQCTINLLAASKNSSSFTLNSVDDWDYFQSKGLTVTGLDKLQDSMDRMLEQHSIESIKKTMLIHEDIFKHQVRELHRLYRLQKMLMDEVKNETQKTRFWSPMSDAQINHSNFINRHNPTIQTCAYNLQVQSLRDDPSSREQSGVSCSGDNLRMPRQFDIERPTDHEVSAIEEEQAGPSSCRTPTRNMRMIKDGSDEDSEVELTLSIGGSSNSKRKLKSQQPHCMSPELLGCSDSEIKQLHSSSSIKSDGGEQLSSSSAKFEQETKRPHRLFQGLSLNRT